MGIKRAIGDLRELHRSVVDLFDDDRSAEAHASFQIARSAQVFSKNTKEVVDDKLSFSATLMRAGEVHAANRLLAEVEHEVREEEAALIETVNEVKVAQSMRRTRVTRLRLARMIAVASLGSALLTFSAAGMAVAGFLRDRATEVSRPQDRAAEQRSVARAERIASTNERDRRRPMRRLRIGDVDLLLTASEFQTLKQLTGGGDLDTDGLRGLLNSLPGALADRIHQAITVAEGEVASTESTVATVVATAEKPSIRKKRAAKKAAEARNKAAASKEQEPTPQPTPSGEDKKDEDTGSEGEEGGDTEQKAQEEEGDGGLPIPFQP